MSGARLSRFDFGSINIDLFFWATFPGLGGSQEEDSHDSKEGCYNLYNYYILFIICKSCGTKLRYEVAV